MADVLTASAQPVYGQVVLRTEFSATATVTATVERSNDGGRTWTTVRGGNPLTLVGPAPSAGNRIGYLVDTEMPLNTSIRYRSTSNLGVVTSAGPLMVTVDDGVSWLKDPARPWANVRIDDCSDTPVPAKCTTPLSEPAVTLVASGLGAEGYSSDATLFPILNRARPADVYAYRKDAVTGWQVVSKTLASMDTLNVFYAWGGPIFLQLPPEYGWVDRYYQPGEVGVARLSKDLRVAYRLWDVPLTVMDAPVGAAQGTAQNNWCLIEDTYPTWADFTATSLTWAQVQEGLAAPVTSGGYGFGAYGDGPYGG